MDVLLDENERIVRDQARAFLATNCPSSLVRACEESRSISADLWRGVLELGWLDTCLPEAMGGLGLPIPYLVLLCEEVGRHLAPIPLVSTAVAGSVVAEYGSPQQRALLNEVRRGEKLLCYAFQEPDGAWSPDTIRTTGRRDGDHLLLNGEKGFVDNFRQSDLCLIAFRADDATGGLSVVLVDSNAAGISQTALVTTAKDLQALLRLDNVRVPLSAVVGDIGGAAMLVAAAMDLAALLTAAQMQGAARRAAEFAVAYSKDRYTFEQPLGSFQVIQHACADMIIAVDGVELLTHEAAWKLGEGFEAALEISQAKAFASDKCVMVCRCAQQIHGGMGFMMEFDLQLWYRRVVAWSMRCGTAVEHRRRVSADLMRRTGRIRLDGYPALPAVRLMELETLA